MNITFAYDSSNNCSNISVDGVNYQELEDQAIVDELEHIEGRVIDNCEDCAEQLGVTFAEEEAKRSSISCLERSFPTANVRFELY